MGFLDGLFGGKKNSTSTQGSAGVKGDKGDSAYQVWISLGNVGTEQDFINALRGPQGPQGVQGVQGIQGMSGPAGVNTSAGFLNGLIGDGVTDNHAFLQSVLDNLPEEAELPQIPPGKFYFSKTLQWIDKSIWIKGTANATQFIFKNGVGGFLIGRTKYVYPSRIKNIRIITHGIKQGSANGIEIHTITELDNVWVQNFAGDGFRFIGDISGELSDVSHSKVTNCHAIDNGGNGLYAHGGDANAIGISGLDARDNKGYGIWDDTFLGIHVWNCMLHNNERGHIRANNGNNGTTINGCYAEEDSPPSIIGGAAFVGGGVLGYQVLKDQNGQYYIKDDPTRKYTSGGYFISSPWAKVIAPH